MGGKGKLKQPPLAKGRHVGVRAGAGGGGGGGDDEWYYRPFKLSLRRLDVDGPFGWSGPCAEDLVASLRRLRELEGLEWREILADAGKHNHRMERSCLVKEAQERLDQLHLGDYEYVYSFRVTKQHRLWGVRDAGDSVTLLLLWCDTKHAVYPMNITDN
jgi:hypothetical protein